MIKHLLSGLHKPEGTPSFNWPGASGKEYTYRIYPAGASFKSVPGNFILAREYEPGEWVPLYIGQTRDLSQRLEGHGHQESALQKGATHLHMHLSTAGQAARCEEERDLIRRWQPFCNEQLES